MDRLAATACSFRKGAGGRVRLRRQIEQEHRCRELVHQDAAAGPQLARMLVVFGALQHRQHQRGYGTPIIEGVGIVQNLGRQAAAWNALRRQSVEHVPRSIQQASTLSRIIAGQALEQPAAGAFGNEPRQARFAHIGQHRLPACGVRGALEGEVLDGPIQRFQCLAQRRCETRTPKRGVQLGQLQPHRVRQTRRPASRPSSASRSTGASSVSVTALAARPCSKRRRKRVRSRARSGPPSRRAKRSRSGVTPRRPPRPERGARGLVLRGASPRPRSSARHRRHRCLRAAPTGRWRRRAAPRSNPIRARWS